MTDIDLNRNTVESLTAELPNRYKEVPIEHKPVDVPAGEFKDHLQNAQDGYGGGAYT